MKGLGFVGSVFGAALLCVSPVSVQWSPANSGSLSVSVATASAAEYEVPAHRRAYRHGRYYRSAYYDPFCGGPYVGGGWNGGSYWGGPWMDLRCYGWVR